MESVEQLSQKRLPFMLLMVIIFMIMIMILFVLRPDMGPSFCFLAVGFRMTRHGSF
jgi:Na+/melibiose symporter-like transporter